MARSVAPQAVGTRGLFRARRLRRAVIGLGAAALALSGMGALAPAAPATTAHQPVHELAAKRLGDRLYFSGGLLAWLRGPSAVQGEVGRAARLRAANSPGAFTPAIGGNVDANDPAEDLAAGQSESAVAAQRRGGSSLVLAAWNDIGAQLASPTTPKGSGTGIGLSAAGGRHFTDLLGLPNDNPDQQWSGDPSVVSLRDGRHFLVSSLYYPSAQSCSDGQPAYATIAVSVVTVNATGTGATMTRPTVLAKPGDICTLNNPEIPPNLGYLDKDWASYDPSSRTLAVSYTHYYFSTGERGSHSGTGQIEVLRAKVPADPSTLSAGDFSAPVVMWPEEPVCPNGTASSEPRRCGAADAGAYVAVAPGGDTYVAWERNIGTNLPGGAGPGNNGDPHVYLHAGLVRAHAAYPGAGGPGYPIVLTTAQPRVAAYGGVRSLDTVGIAGYNRFLGQDFPRIAIDRHGKRIIFVWNDGNLHPLGDIWLRSSAYGLTGLGRSTKVNDDDSYALHFMPAVSVRDDGTVCTSWYDRRAYGADSTRTAYVADCRTSLAANSPDRTITTGPTDWAGTSTVITPNFGDYTDNATDGTTTYYTWTDGRLGVPQPFVAR